MLAPGVVLENGLKLHLTKNYVSEKGKAEQRGGAR
jgi:hypothetical protein